MAEILPEILIVEDDPLQARLAEEIISYNSFQTNLNIVYDGAQAWEYLQKNGKFSHAKTPDLIMLDLNLPICSGFDVLTKMKNDENLKNIPVIILTASDNDADIFSAYRLDAIAFMQKPFSTIKFKDAIEVFRSYTVNDSIFSIISK